MKEEFQPDWDYQAHERAAEEVGRAALEVEETQQALDAKRFKRLGYEKHWARGAQERLGEKQAAYDNQILEAKSRQDLAHEQALQFTAIAERYKETAKKLKEEFGIELPEKSMDDIIRAGHWDWGGSRGQTEYNIADPASGEILALRDLFEPEQKVEGDVYDGHYLTRLPREGLGQTLEEAESAAETAGKSRLLHIRSGEAKTLDDGGFYHGRYKDLYIPISDEINQMLEGVGVSRLDSKISRSYRYNKGLTGVADIATRFDVIDLDSAKTMIEREKMPVSAEVSWRSLYGSRSYFEDGKVSTLKGETPEELRQSILELVAREGVLAGKVVINGQETDLRDFLLGKQETENREAA
jgi:hypothetical protein